MIVGQLYPRTDVRRDGAYTIFYMGINLGAALGSLLCGYLGQTYGWSYGFGAAGVGMLLGLIVFIWGKPLLLGAGEAPDAAWLARSVAGIKLEWLLYLVGLAAVVICWWLVQNQAVVGTLLGIGGTYWSFTYWASPPSCSFTGPTPLRRACRLPSSASAAPCRSLPFSPCSSARSTRRLRRAWRWPASHCR